MYLFVHFYVVSKAYGRSGGYLLSPKITYKSDTIIKGLDVSCSEYINNLPEEIYNIGLQKTEISEIKNGLVYVHKKGILNLLNGELFDLKKAEDRKEVYKVLKDSVLCLWLNEEQYVFNLLSNYQYYRKRWSTGVFKNIKRIESYNGTSIPIFENDSTLLIVDITTNRIIKRISGNGKFTGHTLTVDDHLFIGNKRFLYEINMINGNVDSEIELLDGLQSNVLSHEGLIIYWDRGQGLVAYDTINKKVVWKYGSKYNDFFVKIMVFGNKIFFNDGKFNCLDTKTGKLLWTDNTNSSAVNEDNFTLTEKYLVTGIYGDSEGVIVLIDNNTGIPICSGREMSNDIGLYRYDFFHFSSKGQFYGIDGGGYEKKIVSLKLNSMKE